jgi:glycosyltransferase involved in cell wall biosynthesis
MNKYFVYTGNAYPHKNLNRLIEAVVELNKETDQVVQLKIASSRNVFVKRLESLVKKLNAGKYIDLLGFVPDEKLPSLYKGSVAFVFPSLSEGFGLPGMQAMQEGTLVLASDIPVFREVYKDAAAYFNPHDFSSIQKALQDALSLSDEKRKEKISYSQKFITRYSWEKMAKQTLKVYESFK